MSEPVPQPHWCEELYEAQAAGLILYGRALGLSHAEAEDVVQDLFQTLLRQLLPPENPTHYLLRAFRNRCLNRKRSLLRRCLAEIESSRWFERLPGETARERAAMRALARLPQAQREVLILRHWHGLTFEQAAALLGISPNTAAGRHRYGIARLRHLLDSIEPDIPIDTTESHENHPAPMATPIPLGPTSGTDL